MEDILNNLKTNSFDFLVDLVVAIIILIVGFKLIKLLSKFLKKEHRFSKMDITAKEFIVSLITIALKVVLFIIAATIVGIPTTSFITIIGSSALAVGLALQGGLSNLAGGVMILTFKPFKIGDYIEANGKEGTVKSITMFYTSLTTPDNKVIEFPNGNLLNSEITNYSANTTRRVDIELNTAYNVKIDRVKKVVNQVIDNNEYVLQDKEKIIRLKDHADSSLKYVLRVWVKTEDYWNAYFSLKEETKEAFDKNNIEIPYPQIDVHNK
jgi:small conductance mechanosensitive channel